jgi:hypothetical protein
MFFVLHLFDFKLNIRSPLVKLVTADHVSYLKSQIVSKGSEFLPCENFAFLGWEQFGIAS